MKAFFSKNASQKTSAAYSNTTKPSGARVVYLYEDGQPVDGKGVRMEFTPDVCRTLDDVKLLIKQTLHLPCRPAWLKAAHNGNLIHSMSEMTTDMAVIYDAQARNLAVSTSSSGSKEAAEDKTHRKVKSTGTIELQNIVSAAKVASSFPSPQRTTTTTCNTSDDVISKIWKRLESLEMRMENLQRETLTLRVEQDKLYKQLQSLTDNSRRG
ncbi:hypothetical protein Gasu2_35470 [Galdieria sulphuraria]|uniref:Uncharacterized protein n=1 Tax=Galdieria sulphuraria TaxID=130081 RepID=M2XC26_GALSU|nr:uncharacterized protein Gasu_50430 [Galdieria sulphuraria]EME27452.1 hypothetical protein Gasu_50430 [Galdieria sulphuraria]GJD09288.1 hypothetical protein Gasu2_35470 [Galdieria sulphuraria]|eukprot:XP_005703972.1 hypothetical protein Gasu_50430 [Galdieria sulphuraria]